MVNRKQSDQPQHGQDRPGQNPSNPSHNQDRERDEQQRRMPGKEQREQEKRMPGQNEGDQERERKRA